MKSWDEFGTLGDHTGWAEVSENGWGTLLAWVAGPDNARRRPASDDGRTVRVVTERAGVAHETTFEPFTADDRDLIEDAINSYIGDAGVPPRPRGYTWYIRVHPSGLTPEAFLDRVEGSVLDAPPEVVMPGQWRECMESVLTGIYQASEERRPDHGIPTAD